MTETIISVRQLSHIYETAGQSKPALNDITLDIPRAACVAIIGVTGSGKSTLVQHFNGLLRPTSGSVLVDGIDVSDTKLDQRLLRQRVGMLFQFPETQLFERTVYADVAFGPRRMKLSRHEVRSRVIAALETVGLPHHQYAARSPFELSGGQRRRIALAGVLAMQPSILILDEPTVGLDADGRAEFYAYVQRIQREQGVTVILVSHDMAEVATLAERIFVLHHGKLVLQGTPRDVFANGEQLQSWGLAAPPLSEFLTLLRQHGLPIPAGTFTLDEAFAALQNNEKNIKYAE